MPTTADPQTLTVAEVADMTGKARASSQAAVLAKMGVPFRFTGRAVIVERAVALAHELLTEHPRRGIDLSKIR